MSQKFKSEVELQALNAATTDTDKFLVSDGGIIKFRTGAEMLSDLGVNAGAPASTIQHQVKAAVAINKGQAVYVSSADGTNMIVSLASNATEATSSKTMGLLADTVAINGFSNVIAEGLLAGLNTSTAVAGDPVWLGTGGNLIYGLTNKPYAPAHLVFIGIVTRVNVNNGEIFVKVQNGFELDELHDVDLKSLTPVSGHLLGFNGNLWINKTITGWLGYTPADSVHNHTFDSLTLKTGGTSTYQTSGDFRAPVFYDSNNTGYYINPAATSNLDTIQLSTLRSPIGDWVLGYTGGTTYSFGSASTSDTLNVDFNNWNFNNNVNFFSQLAVENQSTFARLAFNKLTFWDWQGGIDVVTIDGGYLEAANSLRAPIFYDSSNTGFYLDPASTSNTNLFAVNQLLFPSTNFNPSTGPRNTEPMSVKMWNNYFFGTGLGSDYGTVLEYYSLSGHVASQTYFDAGGGSWYRSASYASGWQGWQRYVTDVNIGSYAAAVSHTHTFDSLTSKTGGTGNYQTSGQFIASSFADSDDTSYYANFAGTGDSAVRQRGGTLHGPNPTWGKYLLIGGDGRQNYTNDVDTASVCATDGNLHIDAASTKSLYFNYYDGDIIYLGNGASSIVSSINNDGSHRPQIIYDYNNTAYYLNPDGGSNLNTGNLAGRFTYSDYLVSNNSGGLMGDYNINGTADKVIWTIGESWPLANMYGLGYSYGNGYGHHLVIKNNGSVYHRISFASEGAFFTGVVTASGSSRAPIFYDTDNTGYYVDAASTSNLNGLTVAGTITGNISGNSGTATTLQTARTINGTSFNGASNIETSYWGATRTLTIGNTGKTVNGSGNQSWTLAEIGAQPAGPYLISEVDTLATVVDRGNTTNGGRPIRFDTGGGGIHIKGSGGGWATGYYFTGTSDTYRGGFGALGGNDTLSYYWIGPAYNNYYTYTDADQLFHTSSVRSPIFYDSDNTAYFLNIASTSEVNKVYYNSNMVSRNYGLGQVGVYNASRYQAVFSMGESYILPADGTTAGNLYGMAWSHPNAGGVAGNLNTHGLLVMENGTFLAAISGSIRSRDDMRAPIFYDSNNTAYYTDPTAMSSLYDLTLSGAKHTYLYINPGNTWEAMVKYNGGSGSPWYVGKRTSNDLVGTESFHFYSEAAGITVAGVDTSGNMHAYSSMRAPIFYDSNNTGYYCDPASTSNLNGLFVGGLNVIKTWQTISGNIDSDYGEGFVTFDPIPSGTPPLASPNIRTVNIGNSFSRRTQLAFDYASDVAYFRRKSDTGWHTWREFIHSGNIGSQSVSYATTAGTASGVTWGNVTSKPSNIFYYQGFTLDANTMDTNASGFTYSNNATYTGPIMRIGDAGYSLQLNAAYSGGGSGIAFRTRNGDAGTFNPWRVLLNDANYTSYTPSLTGSGASGTWGINITGSASSAGSVDWSNIASKTAWMTTTSLIASHNNANDWRNSGFYENDGGGSNWPSGTWYNSINVRHSNQGNYHGFQMAMSYYDNNLWFRSYQGSGSFQQWETAIGSGGSNQSKTGFFQSNSSLRAPIFYDSNDTTYYINPADSTTAANFAGKVQFNYGGASSSTLIQTTGSYGTMGINTYYGTLHTTGSFYIGNPAGGAADLTANNGTFSIIYDRSNSAYYFDGSSTGDSIRVAGDIVAYYSDDRLKDRKGNIENAIEKVLSLNGFYYEANQKAQELGYKKKMEIGVSAQEVEAILPELIKDAPIGQGYKTLDYGRLTPLLIEAIKEQQKQIEELKELVNKLITK